MRAPGRRRWGRGGSGAHGWGLLLAAISGVALGATYSPHGGPVLPFLAFAPLGAALARLDRTASSPSPILPPPVVLGFTAATIAHALGFLWMIPALSWRTPLAIPAWILVASLGGLVAGVGSGAACLLARGRPHLLPLVLAVCWTGAEWTLAHLPGVRQAWLATGASLAWEPALAAGAELFGARFLTLWTVAAGASLGMLGARLAEGGGGVFAMRTGTRAHSPGRWPYWGTSWGRGRWRGVAIALAAVAPLVWGLARQAEIEEAGDEILARVAVVQPGREGGEPQAWRDTLRALGERESFDLVVFPEGFFPEGFVPEGLVPEGLVARPGDGVAGLAQALDRTVVAGIIEREIAGSPEEPDTLWYNSAIAQPPNRPRPPPYRKTRLVPGLETAGLWPSRSGGAGGYRSGREERPLPVDGRLIGVMICYDSAFAASARSLVRAGADWLLVLSDDDWLDPARPFRTTWAYWQHATHGRLRALEHRVGLLQAGATGFSFAVTAAGRGDPFALEPGSTGVRVLAVTAPRGPTLFTRFGDLLGLVCFAVFAAGLVAAVRGGWRL